jgi:F420-dependent oxidoreductase-like protein
MRLRIFVEPQLGATFDDQLAVARRAEDAGFDAFFRSDHFLTMGSADGLPGPTDAWLTLAGLAVATSRIRLGTLMTSATFRHPGLLAVGVAQVDQMSGGRVEVGLGAGWYEREHEAYGVPFPGTGERFDRLAEQLAVVTGLWATPTGSPFSHRGEHYTLRDSPALPKPVQRPGPPLIVGGWGPRRTPELAARYADEFNAAFRPVPRTAAQFDRVREACDRLVAGGLGREPMVYSAAQVVCCGRTDAELRRRAEAIGRPLEVLRENGVAGTPDEVVQRIGEFAAIGAGRLYCQLLDMSDLEHVDLLSEVAAQLPG